MININDENGQGSIEINDPGGPNTKVSNYFAYMAKKVGSDNGNAQNKVFTSGVFTKEALQQILDSEHNYDGIRFYLTRESDDEHDAPEQQESIKLMGIPVKRQGEFFKNQTAGNDLLAVCPSTHCPQISATDPDLNSE